MGKILDTIIATMIPSGSVYKNQKPLVSVEMKENLVGKTIDLSSKEELVKKVESAIGSKNVVINKIYGNRLLMPWNADFSGKTIEVRDLLKSMHEEGWPGYDTDLNIIQVFKGTGRFGKTRYMVSLTKEAFETGYPHSGVEVYPVKNK